jgi:oligosaccharyltransferase complex subunit epsilon
MKKTPKKAKLIDAFCVFCFVVTGLQFLYMLMVGTILKNGLYAGLFTSFGSMILTSTIPFPSMVHLF